MDNSNERLDEFLVSSAVRFEFTDLTTGCGFKLADYTFELPLSGFKLLAESVWVGLRGGS